MKRLKARKDIGFFLNEKGLTGFGVEVGTFEGAFSKHLLETWKGSLYVVDVWDKIEGNPFHDFSGFTEQDMRRKAVVTIEKLCQFPGRYVLMCVGSPRAASHFPDEFFDFVYIDASHFYKAVRADLQAWWPKLKPGGLFAGHDYIMDDVRMAVDEFAVQVNREARLTEDHVETISWWFLK